MSTKRIALTLIIILSTILSCVSVEAGNKNERIKVAPIIICVDDDFADDPANHTWNSIQEGINDANESDTVYVHSGIYHESIVINKAINLTGEDRNTTVIDGDMAKDVVSVSADWVNISGFTVKNGGRCISIFSHSNNNITNTTLLLNDYGVFLDSASNNSIIDCNISNNLYGIYVTNSSFNNSIYNNNFIDNTNHACDNCLNYWDNGYPSGGNYWKGCIGIADSNHGKNQDIPGSDGIYDEPFNIPGNSNQDRYPLTHPFFWWDETLPKVSVFTANNSVIKPETIIDFEINDENLNIVRCSINEEEYEPFTSPYNLTANWDDGTYNIIIYADDYGRNERYEYFTFTVDGTEPDITLISPENNTVTRPGTIIDFDIDDAHLNLTTYTLNGGLHEMLSSPYNIDTGGWEDGAYNITIRADDLAGNENYTTFRFMIDGTPPDISVTNVSNGSYYNTNVTISVDISDAHLDEDKNIITLDNVTSESGVTISSEGTYVLYVYATDIAGNNASKKIIFTIDKIPPVISDITPADGSKTDKSSIIVSGKTEPNATVKINYVNVNVSSDGSFSREINLVNGYNLITITVTDLAGNTVIQNITIERTEEEGEEIPDYLIYLISIPVVFVVALVAVIAFLKRKIIVRCPACKTVFNVKPGKRPLRIKCPKCGREGVLR